MDRIATHNIGPERRAARARCVALTLVTAMGPALCGCTSTTGFLGRNLADDEKTRQMASADGIHGPLERSLLAIRRDRRSQQGQSLAEAEGREEYLDAERRFQEGKYAEAEVAAKQVAKKFKDSPVFEDALFLIAEAQFHQKKYSWAQDSYDLLLNEFKSTRYLDRSSRRLFTIARYWLGEPDYVTSDDVRPAGFDERGRPVPPVAKTDEKPRSLDPSQRVPIFPNFVDRTRPVFDTEGRALQALKSIWLKDPTGPLADDALMLTAGYHLRKGNFLEADHLYTILREEYPKGPYAEHAHLLGGHVKLASYQGSEYDGKTLEEAEQLKESTLRLYPGHPQRERLKDELRKIEEAKAGQDWAMVEFYRRKTDRDAMAVYCREILRLYPTTSFADRARQLLNDLEPADRPVFQDSRHDDQGRARL